MTAMNESQSLKHMDFFINFSVPNNLFIFEFNLTTMMKNIGSIFEILSLNDK